MSAKADFMKAVTILIDSREKRTDHITAALDGFGVAYETVKLDIGDISFRTATRDFRQACTVERKGDVDELYANLMEKAGRGNPNRLEKEVAAGSRAMNQFTLLIEGIGSMDELRAYMVPNWKMKACPQRVVTDIGKTCYAALRAWQSANRYNFRVEFVKDPANTAAKLLEEFYYYYHNYKALVAPRR